MYGHQGREREQAILDSRWFFRFRYGPAVHVPRDKGFEVAEQWLWHIETDPCIGLGDGAVIVLCNNSEDFRHTDLPGLTVVSREEGKR